ncbi:rhombosortase [Thalassotalea mangrovi]|uniref:Rhombosortase n=1 Tax=Thalassotalea mangrovi TaxID=2572245 RepID=A0A4U1B775_9GAMM|nr:rhombosortase [Thalassotalea mangrovi]TKB45726.1 rhombosortase [Thalassotalea mangrovi]
MLKLSLPWQTSAWLTPLITLVISIAVFWLPESISDSLIYDRNAINAGQYWRLLTGHFDHTNLNHMLLNIAGLTMLWALHGDHYRHGIFITVFLVSALACSIGIYLFDPQMLRYVGLSGVLHGIFVFGAIADIRTGDKTGYLLLLGVSGKILYEQTVGASSEMEEMIGANVAVDAHLYGALGGVIAAFLLAMVIKHQEKPD